MKRKFGRFVLSKDIIENNPDKVMELMGKCIPIRVEFHYESDTFHYVAISNEFDELNDGESIHSYVFHVSKTTVTAHRIKDLLNKDFSNGYSTIIIDE